MNALCAGAVAVLLALATSAAAQMLPQPLVQAHPEYRLKAVGQGKLRWFGLHIYDARLWADSGIFGFAQPFALGVRYARDFSGDKIAQSSLDEIAHLGFGSPADRERWGAEMRRIFPHVAAGHELLGLNVPGYGARFYHDGKYVGEIAEPEFARAFFSIWLDPRTRLADLRAALLGREG